MAKHSRSTENGRAFWMTERLWKLSANLPVVRVSIESIAEFDQNCWFDEETPPTCRAVAKHLKRVMDADLACPVILSSDGRLMDGGHRIAKAWLQGETEIDAVQFQTDPEPDYITKSPSAKVGKD